MSRKRLIDEIFEGALESFRRAIDFDFEVEIDDEDKKDNGVCCKECEKKEVEKKEEEKSFTIFDLIDGCLRKCSDYLDEVIEKCEDADKNCPCYDGMDGDVICECDDECDDKCDDKCDDECEFIDRDSEHENFTTRDPIAYDPEEMTDGICFEPLFGEDDDAEPDRSDVDTDEMFFGLPTKSIAENLASFYDNQGDSVDYIQAKKSIIKHMKPVERGGWIRHEGDLYIMTPGCKQLVEYLVKNHRDVKFTERLADDLRKETGFDTVWLTYSSVCNNPVEMKIIFR